MSGLQTILNKASSLDINRRNVVGIQYTRNELPRVSLTPTYNPWKFTLEMPASLRYSTNRDLLEALDTLDRYGSQVITFNDNVKLSWIFRYQGAMTSGQISAITVTSYTGNQLVLGNLPSVSAGTVLFEPNDLIQIGAFKFPTTSETQVLRGAGSTVTITTHRPNIIASSVVGLGITVGAACQFTVFCPNMPSYKIIPGGTLYSNGTMINNGLIEFSDSFQLYEYIN